MNSLDNKPKYFIGREKDLEKIEAAKNNNDAALLTIKGGGGIGKTTLLNKYREKIIDEGTPKSNILQFDFDEYRYRTACDIRLNIAEKLGKENFNDYLYKRRLLKSQQLVKEQLFPLQRFNLN